ncbi:hypothetical protein ACFLV5_01340 [Chloroflexota bacterium]
MEASETNRCGHRKYLPPSTGISQAGVAGYAASHYLFPAGPNALTNAT